MKTNVRSWYRKITFHGLSLQKRLPFLICVLLCSVILTFSFLSYYGVKNAALDIGKHRLRTLTDQLATMFNQSTGAVNTAVLAAAQQDVLKKNIRSGGIDAAEEALAIVNKLKNDSTWLLVAVLDSNKTTVLQTKNTGVRRKLSIDTIFSSLSVGPNACKVGKAYVSGDSMFYPIVASITDQKKVMGYMVIWRSLYATPKVLEQLSQLMGTGATLYVGNSDGSLWTNFIKPVSNPPIDITDFQGLFEYSKPNDERVIAAVQRIAGTKWLVLIEFSEKTILESATIFLRWIILIGGALIAIGILITWIMSRNLIRPLKQLTAAADRIASGEYSHTVEITRMDEIGKLVNAFNIMAEKVRTNQLDLENKVAERTAQLETANKEMESFSYSVSHDLRAPLRGIIGFTSILEEKYINGLDAEAKRLSSIIKNNTLKMGNLIDDLLAFSKLGRSDLVKTHINTKELVKDVIKGLDAGKNIVWEIGPLPDMKGDPNTIRQVWINLISNAIKYSRNNEQPKIDIGTTHQNGQVSFFVKDNGVGFDQKYAGKLFKVFQRLHASNEFEGTGIGLAIVEKVISKHGGNVWVEAEKNNGAKFFFEIPS
ncbi:MAG: ATP-binding protein [Ferruginibacter sp.]